MTNDEIIQRRLQNQALTGKPFETLVDVVRWLGAVQAQEYYQAKWALALRANGFSDADVEEAFAAGRILRTHVMRPTWHFVTPEDIRWLLKLTAPRVNVAVGSYYRKHGLDDAVFARSNEALARALQGGKYLTRAELEDALRALGIVREEHERLRFTLLVMRAELDGVICSGPRRGKQFTYALLEERVPPGPELDREEALAELTRRFFGSHGPATEYDFGWWSGLTLGEVREGLALAGSELASTVVEDQTYWFVENGSLVEIPAKAWLLPSFDEYLIGYKDRSAALDPGDGYRMDRELSQPVVYAGKVIGTWKRQLKRDETHVTLRSFADFDATHERAIDEALAHYSAFLEMPVRLSLAS